MKIKNGDVIAQVGNSISDKFDSIKNIPVTKKGKDICDSTIELAIRISSAVLKAVELNEEGEVSDSSSRADEQKTTAGPEYSEEDGLLNVIYGYIGVIGMAAIVATCILFSLRRTIITITAVIIVFAVFVVMNFVVMNRVAADRKNKRIAVKPVAAEPHSNKYTCEIDYKRLESLLDESYEILQSIVMQADNNLSSNNEVSDNSLCRNTDFARWLQLFAVYICRHNNPSLRQLYYGLKQELEPLGIFIYDELQTDHEGNVSLPKADYYIDNRSGEEWTEVSLPIVYTKEKVLMHGQIR